MRGCEDGVQKRANHDPALGLGGPTIGYGEPSVLLFYTFELVGKASRLWVLRVHLSFVLG